MEKGRDPNQKFEFNINTNHQPKSLSLSLSCFFFPGHTGFFKLMFRIFICLQSKADKFTISLLGCCTLSILALCISPFPPQCVLKLTWFLFCTGLDFDCFQKNNIYLFLFQPKRKKEKKANSYDKNKKNMNQKRVILQVFFCRCSTSALIHFKFINNKKIWAKKKVAHTLLSTRFLLYNSNMFLAKSREWIGSEKIARSQQKKKLPFLICLAFLLCFVLAFAFILFSNLSKY